MFASILFYESWFHESKNLVTIALLWSVCIEKMFLLWADLWRAGDHEDGAGIPHRAVHSREQVLRDLGRKRGNHGGSCRAPVAAHDEQKRATLIPNDRLMQNVSQCRALALCLSLIVKVTIIFAAATAQVSGQIKSQVQNFNQQIPARIESNRTKFV